jgi:acyl dehydratase
MSPHRPIPLPPLSPLRLLQALLRPTPPPAETGAAARYRLAALDRAHLQRYRRYFGFHDDGLPLTYLALLAQRAQFDLMLGRTFAYRIAGVIHAEQTIERLAEPDDRGAIDVSCRLELLPAQPNSTQSVQFSSELTQHERIFSRSTSRLVVRRGRRSRQSAGDDASTDAALLPLHEWQVTAADSRRYARLSGDWNPIHLSTPSARLFGLSTPIVHGMAALARAEAALEQQRGRPLRTITARFRRPIPLGTAVTLQADRDDWQVQRDGRNAVIGSATD